MKKIISGILIIFLTLGSIMANVEKVSYHGYDECYRISNGKTEVIINPEAGGRILRYALDGKSMIYLNPRLKGKTLKDFKKERFDPDAGRFDIGAEDITRDIHDNLWIGPYTARVTGDYSVKITSMKDPVTGLMLEREFILDPESSHLRIILGMQNISDEVQEYYFWSRTLCNIGGKTLIPLKENSKYPNGWGKYKSKPWKFVYENVEDELVNHHDSLISIKSVKYPGATKVGVDSDDGWMAYGNDGMIFLKRFPYNAEGEYDEPAGQTIVYYSNGISFVELEPVSEAHKLKPGEKACFEENWWLIDYPPADGPDFDVKKAVETVLSVKC